MALEKEFEENRGIVTEQAPIFDLEAFILFAKNQPPEVAKGYLLALADIQKHMQHVMVRIVDQPSGQHREETPPLIRNKMRLFHVQLNHFLNDIKSAQIDFADSNSLQNGPV